MLAYISGKILQKGKGYLIVENGQIGYQVFVAAGVWTDVNRGDTAAFYLHHNVKEDAQDLYGFKTFAELEFFKLLISISGVGPKSALGVLALASVDELKASIAQGDPSLLDKVSGIGKKTAERIVLELKNKIAGLAPLEGGTGAMSVNSDEIDALIALGYSLQQAREALNQIDKKITDSGQRIRAALKRI
jgi:Holliday junction DNA helicase RuvA